MDTIILTDRADSASIKLREAGQWLLTIFGTQQTKIGIAAVHSTVVACMIALGGPPQPVPTALALYWTIPERGHS